MMGCKLILIEYRIRLRGKKTTKKRRRKRKMHRRRANHRIVMAVDTSTFP